MPAKGKRDAVRTILALLLPWSLLLAPTRALASPVASHTLAAERALAPALAQDKMPRVARLGSLEARIYRCECGSGVHLWDVAGGLRLWAAAHGLQIATHAAVLRGEPGDPRQPDGTGQATARLESQDLRRELAANRPVILTYSLDSESATGAVASFRSQQRVSLLAVAFREGNPGGTIVAQIPPGAEKDKMVRALLAFPWVKRGDQQGQVLIPWDLPTGNLIATFVILPEPTTPVASQPNAAP